MMGWAATVTVVAVAAPKLSSARRGGGPTGRAQGIPSLTLTA